ncbi:rab3 GTPase activating protein isoform X1 [Rhodnius prolixus]|uniref:rab3 GTPase activating protein isoform X1 n=1 Tax=Rhodnius prolixus TaxID=13249 RepID=UPI003D18868B
MYSMTSQFKSIGCIVDLEEIKKILFRRYVIEDFGGVRILAPIREPIPKENWLEECLLSLSPTSELLVLAKDKNFAILNAKWDSGEENEAKIKYMLSWNSDPIAEEEEPNEKITSVLCLPVAGQGKVSAHGGADWTAIAVGFTSGAVRFYTETGGLLLSEVFHDEEVISLKFQSYQASPNPQLLPDQYDELHITYKHLVCSVHGLALYNTLKACRNQLAKQGANYFGESRETSLPLALSKWALPDQEVISDTVILGTWTSSPLTHLITASVRGGYIAFYRSSPPQVTTILATGVDPFVGYHSIVEGTAGTGLADVAWGLASKVKTAVGYALPTWFSKWTPPSNVKENPPVEPPEMMTCRFGLWDTIRKGERIYISPQKNLSVVCDSLGRVMLIDNFSGTAVRMWKGYRDAECAFITVDEEKVPGVGRSALYLAIYAPKKGIVEVWALQQGPKVATLLASKFGRLLYIKHGIMGLNSTTSRNANFGQHSCVFINNLGIISEVYVPFHSIFNDRNDPKSRDLYILKQVRRALRFTNRIDDVVELCSQIISDEARLQALQLITTFEHVTAHLLQRVITNFYEKIEEERNDGNQTCLLVCKNLEKVMHFYTTTLQLQEAPPEYSTVVRTSYCEDEAGLSKLLRMNEDEVRQLISLAGQCPDNGHITSVKFALVDDGLALFLASLIHSITQPMPLVFSPDISVNHLAKIGEVLCQCVLYGSCTLEDWKEHAVESGIEPKSLFYAAICYWLKKPLGSNVTSELGLFTRLLIAITSIVSIKETPGWWDQVRSFIMESQNLTNALTATMISRSVYLGIEEKLTDEFEDEWEAISRESCMWSQLSTQVEAVTLLQSTICFAPKQKYENLSVPCLDYVQQCITLSQVVSKGPGRVCECVSKWVSSWGLAPDWLLYEKEKTPSSATGSDFAEEEQLTPADEARPSNAGQEEALKKLTTLRQYFPSSLSSGPLLSYVVWEYIVAWNKEPDIDKLLSTALTFLRYIPFHSLRQGLCSIIWNVHIRLLFEQTVKLINRFGKLPPEKLCKLNLNMVDGSVKHWLRNLYDFFNIFIESVTLSEENCENWSVERETLWTGADEMQPSLAEIALAQAAPNIDVLDIMCQAVRAMVFLAAFPSLKLHKPIKTLFDSFGEACLWSDIKSNPQLPNASPDKKLSDERTKYLMKVIAEAIEKFASGKDSDGVTMKETIGWISQCYSLANDWSLSADKLRIEQVLLLYDYNLDQYAQEIIGAVNDKESLGNQLLDIVGHRLKYILTNSPQNKIKETVANLSPSLKFWIEDQDVACEECDIKDIVQLANQVVNLLPETNVNYKFALLLAEAIAPLSLM